MKLILMITIIASLNSQAGTLAEDLIALAANGASLGLYSRQLEVDIQKAKLEIEKEYALKMQDIMDQAKQNRMKILSDKLAQLKEQKIQVDHLKQKIVSTGDALRRVNMLAKKGVERQLEVSADVLALASSLSAQEASLLNLSSLLAISEDEQGACQGQDVCEWILFNNKMNQKANELGLTGDELLELGSQLSDPGQLASILNTTNIAVEILRNAKRVMTVKSSTLEVEILGIENSLKELQK